MRSCYKKDMASRGDDDQLAFAFPAGWGGARKGAGRKRGGGRRNVAHRARGPHRRAVPVHVTVRCAIRSLRAQFVFPTVRGVIARANRRSRGQFRIVEYSVQADHLHLIAEAEDRRALSSGMRGFAVSLARQVNRLLFRRGAVVADRWHEHALTTPRAVRHAIAYVFRNARKHGEKVGAIDPLSSAMYFRRLGRIAPYELDSRCAPRFDPSDRWRLELNHERGFASPVAASQCWLLSTGWKRRAV
jgi:putative transposase